MKINKNLLLEDANQPDESETVSQDLTVDDVAAVSTDDLADAVQDAAEEASDGAETFSDEKAVAVANEIKTYARGFDAAAWAPLDVQSELTDKLDDCLANALAAKAAGTSDGVDLLVTGLPGSGKTGITKQWARDRGVNLVYLNAKNDDLGAILNGFPVDSVTTDDEGNQVHKVIRSYSNALDGLDKDRSVLFLDEFNRAAPKLRAVLLSLINEHVVDGPGEDGYRHFDNLLFTVACINPPIKSDPGAMDLNDAEMSRFVDAIDWDSKPGDAIKYINFHVGRLIKKLDPADENYAAFYVRYQNILNLANALINDYRFEFDNRDDTMDLSIQQAKMLNQRAITDALMAHGYNKDKFLNWVDKYSKFLDKDKEMIHEILDNWTPPTVTVPGAAAAPETTASTKTSTAVTGDDDLDALFDGVDDEDELDADLFGQATSPAAQAAKVSAAEARQRIMSFDFSANA